MKTDYLEKLLSHFRDFFPQNQSINIKYILPSSLLEDPSPSVTHGTSVFQNLSQGQHGVFQEKISTPFPWRAFWSHLPGPPFLNLELLKILLGIGKIYSRSTRCKQCWLYPYKMLLIARVLILLVLFNCSLFISQSRFSKQRKISWNGLSSSDSYKHPKLVFNM